MSVRIVTTPSPVRIVRYPDGHRIQRNIEPVRILHLGTGPPGRPGAPGSGGSAVGYIHTQGSPALEWIVNHNLNVFPNVTVYSVGGQEVEAQVVHMSLNQTRIYFSTETAGSARFI